ncbi:MAG: hypothetical protein SGILL_008197 [Bacillariaceae sp.]
MCQLMCDSDDNIVVSAPTGAGKSTIFEMAMARFFTMNRRVECTDSMTKSRKILYIAPSKALCEERYDDWSRRLRSLNLGIDVAMITGDATDPGSSFSELASAHLVITTPEKWDSMTRRWTENFYLMASIKLLLVDEVHFLCDENRGWCLETVVTRMKTIHRVASALDVTQEDLKSSSYPDTNPEAIKSSFRMIAVSATLPNMEEFADFFCANEAYAFDQSYRPVPLEKQVVSMGRMGKSEWHFWSNMRETEEIARDLIQKKGFGTKNARSTADAKSVQYFIDMGVAYHHAGLEKEERNLIEQAFANGQIKCLTCTSSLAQGVNLPAALVLIVGSRAYRGGQGYSEVPMAQMLQMIGRAGRPGLDTSGTAVIMTDQDSVRSLERQLNAGFGAAKSKLLPYLPEAMNSAVSNRVVGNMDGALSWFQTTFLFCCMDRRGSSDDLSEAAKICQEAVGRLKRYDLLQKHVVADGDDRDCFLGPKGNAMSNTSLTCIIGNDAFPCETRPEEGAEGSAQDRCDQVQVCRQSTQQVHSERRGPKSLHPSPGNHFATCV